MLYLLYDYILYMIIISGVRTVWFMFDASRFTFLSNISDCVVIISEMNKYLEIKTSEWGLSCIYKTCCLSYKIQFKSSSYLLNNQNSPKGLKNEFSGEDQDLLLWGSDWTWSEAWRLPAHPRRWSHTN